MTGARYFSLLLTEDFNLGVDTASKVAPGGGDVVGTQVGLHSFAIGKQAYLKTFDAASVSALQSTTFTVTIRGATFGDFCMATAFGQNVLGGMIILPPVVTAADTVTVTLFNPTNAAIDLPQVSFYIMAFHPRVLAP